MSADLTMLRKFFSIKTPTVCALYEHLCGVVLSLKRPALLRVLFELRDTVRAVIHFGPFFLRAAVEMGSRTDEMLHCAERAFEPVSRALQLGILMKCPTTTRHLQSLFMVAAAQRDMPIMKLLVGAVKQSNDETNFQRDGATRLLAVVMRQLYAWDFEEPEGDDTIADYIGLLIQGGILSPRLSMGSCCDDRPHVPIQNCGSLTVDELIMLCPPAKRKHLYSVILQCSDEHRIFTSKAGIFNASVDGSLGVSSYLQSCEQKQYDVHAMMQECLFFASRLNDTATASALLALGTDPEVRLLSNNQERYHKGILPWDPIVVAAAAGNLDMLNLLSERVNLACFFQKAPIYDIVQVEDAFQKYNIPTGRELRRLENLQRHCIYSRTQISDGDIADGTVRFDPFGCSDQFTTNEDSARACFVPETRRIDTLTWVRNRAVALGHNRAVDKEIIMAALSTGPQGGTARSWTNTYHPCDVLLLEGLVDANIEYREDDMDLLQLSIRAQCRFKVVEFLLSKGLRVHSRTAAQSGNTMLHQALLGNSCDRSQIVKLLLRDGADYKHCGERYTVLEASLYNVHSHDRQDLMELFTHLLEVGSPLRPGPRQQIMAQSVLIQGLLAADAEDEFILRVLDTAREAELDTQGSSKVARDSQALPTHDSDPLPLQAAVGKHRERLAQEFIRRGADVHVRRGGSGSCPTTLQVACRIGSSLEFVKNLVEVQGVNVNEAPGRFQGFTALQCAAYSGTLSVAEFLLSHGSDVNAVSGDFSVRGALARYRALDFATIQGRIDMVEFLLKAGGRSVTAGLEGAIHIAKQTGHFAILSVLLDWKKKHCSRIIMEEVEWQQKNPDSARLLVDLRNDRDLSGDSACCLQSPVAIAESSD